MDTGSMKATRHLTLLSLFCINVPNIEDTYLPVYKYTHLVTGSFLLRDKNENALTCLAF